MSDVTAVLVTYNSADHVGACVRSLRDAGVGPIRVVDNASGDASAGIARREGAQVSLAGANQGFGAAINQAMAGVTTRYALIVNPDCTVTGACLDALERALEEDERRAAVVPAMEYLDGSFGIAGASDPTLLKEWLAFLGVDRCVPSRTRAWLGRRRRLPLLASLQSYLKVAPGGAPRAVDWVCGWCMLVRNDVFHSVGGFDESFFLYFEDADLCRRFRTRGFDVAIVGDAVALHEESASSSRAGKGPLYARGMRTYFHKYGRAPQRLSSRLLELLMA
jgi:N-acetylglucosaminyl-diphospho-decaprenol L-rhamnosyltransferase